MPDDPVLERRHVSQPGRRISVRMPQWLQRDHLRGRDRLLCRQQPVPERRNLPEPHRIGFNHVQLPGRLRRRLLPGWRQRVRGGQLSMPEQGAVPKFREWQCSTVIECISSSSLALFQYDQIGLFWKVLANNFFTKAEQNIRLTVSVTK